ncbi:MAG: GNAT family N-acetyltransferase [Alphaproteobacteria bacterium]
MLGFLRSASTAVQTGALRGPRVYLQAPRASDFGAWRDLRAASRGFLEPWEPKWPRDALTRTAFRRRLQRQARDVRENTGYSFFIFRCADDELLGGVTLSNLQRGIALSCSMGYWIGAPHTRQGLMTAALRCVLPFAFETLALHRIEAACLPANVASQALLRKLGFREEGYARGYLCINGEWHDHLLFAMLSSDYYARPG